MKSKSPTNKARSIARTRGAKSAGACPECDADALVIVPTPHRFRYGAGDAAAVIDVELPVRRCQACGFEFLDRDAAQAQHEAVCRHLGVMTPAEIRKLRTNLRLSRAELARLTGLGEATIARWERGALIQNEANDRFLQLLAFGDNLKRLRQFARAKRDSATNA